MAACFIKLKQLYQGKKKMFQWLQKTVCVWRPLFNYGALKTLQLHNFCCLTTCPEINVTFNWSRFFFFGLKLNFISLILIAQNRRVSEMICTLAGDAIFYIFSFTNTVEILNKLEKLKAKPCCLFFLNTSSKFFFALFSLGILQERRW